MLFRSPWFDDVEPTGEELSLADLEKLRASCDAPQRLCRMCDKAAKYTCIVNGREDHHTCEYHKCGEHDDLGELLGL